jgi:hypothetical protein
VTLLPQGIPVPECTEFGVRVSRANSGYTVEIWEHEPGRPYKANVDFAKAHAGSLDVALRMAVPYMAAAAEPDPFANLAERRSA